MGLLIGSTLFVSACGNSSANTEEETSSSRRVVKVNTITLSPSTFEEIIPLTGVLSAPNDASLSAQAAGTIIQMVEIGANVNEGNIVARLDDKLIKAALLQARATYESVLASADLAEDTFRRQAPLYSDSIISAIEYETVRTRLNQARAALDQAEAVVVQIEQQLAYTVIRAPFSGIIEERFTDKGEHVLPGTPVARIVDTRNMKVKVGVPERYSADIIKGSSVQISLKAYGGDFLSSSISFVGNVIHPKNRTFMIEVDVANDGRVLKPEMIVDVLITRRILLNQLVLPQSAILRDENGFSVYLIEHSGTNQIATRRQIILGPSYDGQIVVESGLESGQQVITAGHTMVTEGDFVESATYSNF